jgi:hypothetical protein
VLPCRTSSSLSPSASPPQRTWPPWTPSTGTTRPQRAQRVHLA